MKILKIIQKHKKSNPEEVKKFLYKNLPQELLNGLEYDDPKAIERALKLLGIPIDPHETMPEHHHHDDEPRDQHP